MNKRKMSIVLILALVISCFSGVSAFAADNSKSTENELMSVELGTRDLTTDQIKVLQSNKTLAYERSKKDVVYLLNKAQEEMNQDCAKKGLEINNQLNTAATLAASTSTLGTDVTYTSTDTGNKGQSTSGIAGAGARYGTSYSDANTYTAGIGSASSWAYNAKTVQVTGTGSKNAYIRFYGNYVGNTAPGFMGGTAAARINMSVYDVTTGNEIGTGLVADISDTIANGNYNSSISKAVLVSLQAGHTYLLRFGISTSVANYSPQACISDFYDDTNHGIKATKVMIDYQ